MVYCENCGSKLNEGARFCSRCGQNVTKPVAQTDYPVMPPQAQKRTGKPIAGGILIIIAACFCLVSGILFVLYWWWWYLIVIAVFNFWGFAIGLTAGILAIRRTNYVFAIVGSAFVIVGGALGFVELIAFGIILAIIIFILGILGTIFIAISKPEFIS